MTSCAAARAGITSVSELNILNFEGEEFWGNERVVGHAVVRGGDGFSGLGKLISLGSSALGDLIRRMEMKEQDLDQTGFYLNLSDRYFEDAQFEVEDQDAVANDSEDGLPASAGWTTQAEQVIPRLASACELAVPPNNRIVYLEDHAGGVQAIMESIRNLRSGSLNQCIVGGIASCIEPQFLMAAASHRVLKTAVNPAGFMPGEAAAFILLERLDHALSRNAEIGGILEPPALCREECHRLSGQPSLGVALSEAIDQSLSGSGGNGEQIGLIIGDLNGDPFRAMEWGHALSRLADKSNLPNLPVWLPAMYFGEIGAATTLVSICLGIRSFQRSYANTDGILVWVSSDSGAKGAFCLKSYPS